MDLETYNNAMNLTAALQQLQNTVMSISDMNNNKKMTDIAQSNLELNKDVSQKNYELQSRQFEYQTQLNNVLMAREDNAMQRQVADLKAAGLSPLMVSGGSSATPLQSAPAPQKDLSGINQALSNYMGAYNDYYSRRMQRQNFALQNRVQTAQAYTSLAESKLQQEKMKVEKQILDTDLKFYQNHPERTLGVEGLLLNMAAKMLDKNDSTTIPGIKNTVDNVLDESGLTTPSGDFATYGALSPDTKYAHTLDNENYGNDRKTWSLIKEESKEKYYKYKLSKNDSPELRTKLYNTDDYLKKHISLDNWLKMDSDFISYYLKKGQFEGHKKYFE